MEEQMRMRAMAASRVEALADTDDGLYFGDHDAGESIIASRQEFCSRAASARMLTSDLAPAAAARPSATGWPHSCSVTMGYGTPYPANAWHHPRLAAAQLVDPRDDDDDDDDDDGDDDDARCRASATPSGPCSSDGRSTAICDYDGQYIPITGLDSRSSVSSQSRGLSSVQGSWSTEDTWSPSCWSVAYVHGQVGSSAQARQEAQQHLAEMGLSVERIFGSAQIFSRWLFKRERGPRVQPRFILIVGWREVKPVAETIAAVASGQLDRLPHDPKRAELRPVKDEHGRRVEDLHGSLVQTCIAHVVLLAAESRRTDVVIEACQRLLAPICAVHIACDQQEAIDLANDLLSRPYPASRRLLSL
eukprot:TRINITY_DN9913_c0_g1_i4.p1 TRINITY_DN9913_c0_g1~~TRINITY_DN9913_c0_g1_i4.p1  ORF type:complete len:361 (-),score=46.30 TRINITY_DN9913_c0_g1_i4:155-1237(-)